MYWFFTQQQLFLYTIIDRQLIQYNLKSASIGWGSFFCSWQVLQTGFCGAPANNDDTSFKGGNGNLGPLLQSSLGPTLPIIILIQTLWVFTNQLIDLQRNGKARDRTFDLEHDKIAMRLDCSTAMLCE